MLTPYVVTFDPANGSRQDFLNFLDTLVEIKNWYAFLPGAVFVVSDRDLNTISGLIHKRYASRLFFVSVVSRGLNNGWLPQAAWEFVNNPKSSGRWP